MSERNDYKDILILGGYGRAGKAIAAILSEQIYGCITIAGRRLGKAEACVRELQGNPSITSSIIALAVDAADPTLLASAFDKRDLVIVCVSLDETIAKNIIEAVVNSTADYIDINKISDLVLMAWKFGLNRVLSKSKVIGCLERAIQKRTPEPTGVAMIAEAKADFESVCVKLWHYDLYHATAIPTALVAIRMLFSPCGVPGCWFLGEWVETLSFKEALEEMGFHFEIQQVRERERT